MGRRKVRAVMKQAVEAVLWGIATRYPEMRVRTCYALLFRLF